MHAARVLWSYEAIGDRGNLIIAIVCCAIWPVLLVMGYKTGWLFLVVSMFFALLTVARNVIWRRAYRQMDKYSGPITAEFREDSVSTVSQQGNSDLPWSFFKSYAETPDYLYLTAPRRSLSIIPKSAFASDEELDQVRSYIVAQLPRKKMRWT